MSRACITDTMCTSRSIILFVYRRYYVDNGDIGTNWCCNCNYNDHVSVLHYSS